MKLRWWLAKHRQPCSDTGTDSIVIITLVMIVLELVLIVLLLVLIVLLWVMGIDSTGTGTDNEA